MSSRTLTLLWAVVGGAWAPAAAARVVPPESWLRMADVEREEVWLRSDNAAGLVTFRGPKRISEASLRAVKVNGELKNYYESGDSFEIGADAETCCRLSDRVVVAGQVGYARFAGRNMGGSYFIDPTQTPFNLLEFDAGTAGRKRLETYRLSGAVGVGLTRWLAAGAGFDYVTGNYAKFKDLRHINSLMDMVVRPGVLFRCGPRLSVGASYVYRRRIETLLLQIYGKTDQTYVSLLDYGAFFGKREVFGETGYTRKSETKPLFDGYQGGALQIDWQIAPRWRFFAELTLRVRDGYYGRSSPSTVVYSEHGGGTVGYRAVLLREGARNRHIVRFAFERSGVENRENIYDYRNEEVGSNYVAYLGRAKVGERNERSLALHYTGLFGMEGDTPVWRAECDGGFGSRNILASNYPDFRRQRLSWWHLRAAGGRTFRGRRALYAVGLGGGCSSGGGRPCTDGSYANPGESETLTRTLDGLLRQEHEWLTAMRIDLSCDLRIERRIGRKGVRGFVEAEYAWGKAFATEHLGRAMRHEAQVRLGCLF